MRVYLHIGTEKTGTTSIQTYMAENRRILRKYGVVFPKVILFPGWVSNVELPLAVKKNVGKDLDKCRDVDFFDFRRKVVGRIERIIAKASGTGARAVVFSSEHLSSRLIAVDDLVELKGLFPATTEFTIIVYLRRQDELHLSALAESIKGGGRQATLRIPLEVGDVPYGVRYYDYRMMLEPWEEVFGLGSIIVRVYEKGRLSGGDVIRDFLEIIGVKYQETVKGNETRLNTRFSPEFLGFLMRLNPYLNDELRRFLIENAGQIDSFNSGSLIAPAKLQEFNASFAQSNAYVAKRYLSEEGLFGENNKSARFFDPTANTEEVMNNFLALFGNALSVALKSGSRSNR